VTVHPAVEATSATDAILADLRSGAHRGIVVDSPPGAGKSTLVVRAAVELALAGQPLMIVAQTNEQVDDLTVRLAGSLQAVRPDARIGRLSRGGFVAPPRLASLPNVVVSGSLGDLNDPLVTIATAAKWAHVKDRVWPWAIVALGRAARARLPVRARAVRR
jgi:hypothetical protein